MRRSRSQTMHSAQRAGHTARRSHSAPVTRPPARLLLAAHSVAWSAVAHAVDGSRCGLHAGCLVGPVIGQAVGGAGAGDVRGTGQMRAACMTDDVHSHARAHPEMVVR
eukprot:jgi/Ulvmu1/3920/UM018_0143.1